MGRRMKCGSRPAELFAELLPEYAPDGRFQVNSLHGQGIDRLAPALRVEAEAPDGAIEAVSMDNCQGLFARRAMASGMALWRKPRQPGDLQCVRRSASPNAIRNSSLMSFAG